MISDAKFTAASSAAYRELRLFVDEEKIDPRDFALRFPRKLGAALAQRFAERAGKIKVYRFGNLSSSPKFPDPGFASWLMRRPHSAIVVDVSHLAARAEVPVDVQTARTIFHEVGHVLLHSYLLDKPNEQSPYYSESAEAEEENQAWIFAMVMMAIILGDYSENRKAVYNDDDSPSLVV